MNTSNIFINHEIPRDIFSEILSYIYSGPLTNNVMNFFSSSKDLRETYLKEFCNYIRFQRVPLWIPNEYIKHGRRQDEKIERKKLKKNVIISKKRKIESTNNDIISLLKENKVELTSYKVDELSKIDMILTGQCLKELYIKKTKRLELFELELPKLEKLVVEILKYSDFHGNGMAFVDNFPNLRYIKINPDVWDDGFKYPSLLKELVLYEDGYPLAKYREIELPETLESLHVGTQSLFFRNFPKSIKKYTCSREIILQEPVPEPCAIEKFFKDVPIFLTTQYDRDNYHDNREKIKKILSNGMKKFECCGNSSDEYTILYHKYNFEDEVTICHLDRDCILKTIKKLEKLWRSLNGYELTHILLHKGVFETDIFSRNDDNVLKFLNPVLDEIDAIKKQV